MSSSVQHFAASSQAHERRINSRLLPKSLIYVACGESNGGMVLNVSEDGLAVSMAIAVGDEAYSHLHVRMNGLNESVEVPGRMVWTTKSKKRAGIQLIDVSESQREQIREWIALDGVRDVSLLPRAVSHEAVSSPDMTAIAVESLASAEPRSTLLDAFGGTAPETLGPPLPELFASQSQAGAAPPEPSRSQGFDDVRTSAFRENEWDLASVTMIPRKNAKPEGLSAFALILLWIAIPSFGIGILVGRRPLEQWLSRGDAVGKTFSRKTPAPKPLAPVPDILASAHPTDVKFSPELPANLPINTEPMENDVLTLKPAEPYRPASSGAFVDAKLLNSMSTQEARAFKNIGIANSPAVASPKNATFDSKLSVAANNSVPPAIAPFKPVPVQPGVVAPNVSSKPAPVNLVIPNTNSTTTSHEAAAAPAATATAAVPPVSAGSSAVATLSSPNSDPNRNALPRTVAKNLPPILSVSNAAPIGTPLNPSVAASVAPSTAPRLAPVSAQPPMHGEMTIARNTDEQFILKLPMEALPGGQAESMRMQRFVMVPQRGRWHHHSAVAKLTVGELLTHVPPEKPDAKIQPRAGDTVTVRAFVDKDGAVRNLKPVSGRFALMPRVMRTVRDWQFDRTLVDGKPVESEVSVTVEYRGAN